MSTQQPAMQIPAQLVKELRERTNAGFSDCRAALVEAGGDIEKAISVLRKKGQAAAAKKAQREASEGLVGSYIHAGGKIGDRKSTRLNSSHSQISYAVFCLKKKKECTTLVR